ncbi:MAG: hypothetical protein ABI845_02625 [Polaromonas sp.]
MLTYCEVRRWARDAGETELARQSSELINSSPYASRDEFLAAVDGLILELAQTRACIARSAPGCGSGS